MNRHEILPALGSIWTAYWKYILIVVVVAAVAIGGYQACKSDPVEEAKKEHAEKEQEFKLKEAEAQKALNRLKFEGAKQSGRVEELRKDAEEKTKEAAQAKIETDKALAKVKEAEGSTETNVSVKDAEEQRCLTFPDAPGC